jgi:hypothetical protein
MNNHSGGPVFTIPITAAALSTVGAWDLAGITAQSSGRLEVIDISMTIVSTQFSTAPGLALTLLRGSSAASTGASISPAPVKGWPGASTANFTASGPSSTPVSTASAVAVYADAFDGHGRFRYRPERREERLILTYSQRLHLRTTTPSIACTIYGTLVVQDVGKALPS